MSLSVSITPDKAMAKAAKALRDLPDAYPRAAARAINRGLIAGRKVAAQGIRQRYKIASATLKSQGMRIERASARNLDGGELRAKGTMLPVSLFSSAVRMQQIKGQKRQVVRVTIIKGNRKIVKGGFMAKHRIWKRTGPERDAPLEVVSTIGVPYMLRQVQIADRVQRAINETTIKRLEHETNRLLAGIKK